MNSFENNQLFAEFLGFQSTDIGWYDAEETLSKVEKSSNTFDTYELRFDSDWSWLMVVVEKIESLTDIDTNGSFLILESVGFGAKFILDDGTRLFKNTQGETKIEAIYLACIEFIKWYNNQTN